MAHDARDSPSQAFTVTNWTEDLALDCDVVQVSGSVVQTADVLGTLINELQKQGILRGSTST